MSAEFTYTIDDRGVSITFPAKPAGDVRAMLKANGFRWSPRAGLWWRRRVNGAADFLTALDRKRNPDRPDGACWHCKSPQGFQRNMGAATPVLCNACLALADSQGRKTPLPAPIDRTDLDYEDACARACGL